MCVIYSDVVLLLQEYIVDRVKKIGGFTAFNTFIIRELDTMYKLLQTIKNTLQVISLKL